METIHHNSRNFFKNIPRLGGGALVVFLVTFIHICSGDSGGPLTVEQRMAEDDMGPIRRELIGVVSSVGALDCSRNVPDKFTDVAKCLDWIKEP